MEALAAATTITAVLDVTFRVVNYVNASKGATKERKELRDQLRSCEYILQQLKDEADDSDEGHAWAETIRILEAPGAPLGRLGITLRELEAKLRPVDGGPRKLLVSLKWPFGKTEIKEVLTTIESEKSILMLAIGNNTRLLSQRIKETTEENGRQLLLLMTTINEGEQQRQTDHADLKVNIETLQSAQAEVSKSVIDMSQHQGNQEAMQERLDILNWLSTIDHAAHQNDAFAKHQPGTGQWLLDSPTFKEWKAAAESEELFCPGMPGAGKTVLSSIVIDHLQSLAEGGERIGVAYVYCDYRRVDEQTTRDVLASILRQLAQGLESIPRPLKELYTGRHTKPNPRVDQLLATITSITGLYSKVFIAVDALDEARETDGFRRQLISSLHAIQAGGKTKLFLTSRFNSDVIGMLKTSRTIEIRATPEDVKLYLEGHMSQLPAFVGRSPALEDEVKTGISSAVDGM